MAIPLFFSRCLPREELILASYRWALAIYFDGGIATITHYKPS